MNKTSVTELPVVQGVNTVNTIPLKDENSSDFESSFSAQRELSAIKELARSKELAKQRYIRFVNKKRKSGYNRKYLWIRLEKEELHEFGYWLRNQSPENLRKLMKYDDLGYLLSLNKKSA